MREYCKRETDIIMKSRIQNFEDLVKEFHSKVDEGPIHVCEICQMLCYKKSVSKISRPKLPQSPIVEECLSEKNTDNGYICKTCARYLKNKRVPPCSTLNKKDPTIQQ